MKVTESQADSQARRDLGRLRRQRRWQALRNRLGGLCNDLVPAGRVLARVDQDSIREVGLRSVPLDHIAGSSGRYADFDLAFRPLHAAVAERWLSIARARYQGQELPPVRLLKIGWAYFVEDGNHRGSVARAQCQKEIEAWVVELDASSLGEEPSCTRLGYRA